MKYWDFTVKYLLLLAAQVLLWNYFNFTPLLTIVLLPMMVLCLPLQCGGALAMLIAFASGFAVDFLAAGPTGLTVLALVPVAFLRRPLLSLVFGRDYLSRSGTLSSKQSDKARMFLAIMLSTALFLFVYILADSSGTSPLWAMTVKFFSSLILSSAASLLLVDLFPPPTDVVTNGNKPQK